VRLNDLTQADVRALFNYDPETGALTRAKAPHPRFRVGEIVGYPDTKGYLRVGIRGRLYSAHRLIWLYVTGAWPQFEIDHINHQTGDNRWANLREATPSQNSCNRRVRKDSGSGVRGVHLDKRTGRWRAKITVNKRQIGLGFYATKEEAIAARRAGSVLHGEFAGEVGH
jgi:hypothetical protein